MAAIKISGIWKDADGLITHYALHIVNTSYTTRAVKKSKSDSIKLLEKSDNTAYTWIWNYDSSRFVDGQKVEVINALTGKYLSTDSNYKLTDNLEHLIDFDWIKI